MNRYVGRFVIANFVLMVLVAVLAEVLKLNSGAGLAIGATMGSSFFAAAAFAKDHGRAPTKLEKGAFAWRALCATWLISLFLVAVIAAIFVPVAEIRELARSLASGAVIGIGIGVVLFVSAINYVGIRWSFGWFAKLTAEGRRVRAN